MKKYFASLQGVSGELEKSDKKVLDVGCGWGTTASFLRRQHGKIEIYGIDGYKDAVDYCNKQQLYKNVFFLDFTKRRISKRLAGKRFDAAVMIEVIEHLEKQQGLDVLADLEKVCGKIIITTPNGYFEQSDLLMNESKFQAHLSGWTAGDFKKIGFEVHGFNGLKWLRNNEKKPFNGAIYPFVILMRFVSQPICYFFPSLSDGLVAVKKIK